MVSQTELRLGYDRGRSRRTTNRRVFVYLWSQEDWLAVLYPVATGRTTGSRRPEGYLPQLPHSTWYTPTPQPTPLQPLSDSWCAQGRTGFHYSPSLVTLSAHNQSNRTSTKGPIRIRPFNNNHLLHLTLSIIHAKAKKTFLGALSCRSAPLLKQD